MMSTSKVYMGRDESDEKLYHAQEENMDPSGHCPCCGCRCEQCTHTHPGECCYDDVDRHPMCNAKGGK